MSTAHSKLDLADRLVSGFDYSTKINRDLWPDAAATMSEGHKNLDKIGTRFL
jgi:hypothetical protein